MILTCFPQHKGSIKKWKIFDWLEDSYLSQDKNVSHDVDKHSNFSSEISCDGEASLLLFVSNISIFFSSQGEFSDPDETAVCLWDITHAIILLAIFGICIWLCMQRVFTLAKVWIAFLGKHSENIWSSEFMASDHGHLRNAIFFWTFKLFWWFFYIIIIICIYIFFLEQRGFHTNVVCRVGWGVLRSVQRALKNARILCHEWAHCPCAKKQRPFGTKTQSLGTNVANFKQRKGFFFRFLKVATQRRTSRFFGEFDQSEINLVNFHHVTKTPD